jgi:hypothetical protein
LIEFRENEAPCYQVEVANAGGSLGMGMAEEGVQRLSLRISIFIGGKIYGAVDCGEDFFEAGAFAQVYKCLFVCVTEAAQ